MTQNENDCLKRKSEIAIRGNLQITTLFCQSQLNIKSMHTFEVIINPVHTQTPCHTICVFHGFYLPSILSIIRQIPQKRWKHPLMISQNKKRCFLKLRKKDKSLLRNFKKVFHAHSEYFNLPKTENSFQNVFQWVSLGQQST